MVLDRLEKDHSSGTCLGWVDEVSAELDNSVQAVRSVFIVWMFRNRGEIFHGLWFQHSSPEAFGQS